MSGLAALHQAVRASDWLKVARVVRENPDMDVNTRMSPEGTPPLVALANVDLLRCRAAVDALMRAGADPFASSSVGETAAEIALLHNSKAMVKAMMPKPKDWKDYRFRSQRTALHLAAQRKTYARTLIPWLCDQVHFDIEAMDLLGNRPLHTAAAYDSVEAIEALIDLKAFVNPVNVQNQTPLAVAILNGNDDAAEALIKAGGKAGNPHLASPRIQRLMLSRSLDEVNDLSPTMKAGGRKVRL